MSLGKISHHFLDILSLSSLLFSQHSSKMVRPCGGDEGGEGWGREGWREGWHEKGRDEGRDGTFESLVAGR
jgi:hypothetical protein